MKNIKFILYGIVCLTIVLCLAQCNNAEPNAGARTLSSTKSDAVKAKFTLMPSEITGIKHTNVFKEDYHYNIFSYEYLYNGCGVAVGDVNGDSWPDIYFATAFGSNKLFLNLGNFTFQDVTAIAGVEALEGFKTGVTMADVNGDGRLDIYSCRTSKSNDSIKSNHLFINMGNKPSNGVDIPYFEDKARELGLEDNSNSNHASFFDFDRDGDLDVFILNHRVEFSASTKLRLMKKENGSLTRISAPETPFESNRFYRNDNGKFVDITAKAGLTSSAFGLSATPVDIDRDGWIDIYVANDYIEPDYLYINNRDGTFTDHFFEYFRHSSHSSMGTDVADINNDGLDDIMVLDMKPEDPIRYKMLNNTFAYDRYNLLVQYGYGRQPGRNVLQLNTGNKTFIEIAQFAGVAATDWSWAPLIADFDNDGWKDLYITNGYRRDVTDLDYTNFYMDSIKRTGGVSSKKYPDIYDILKHVPEHPLSNYLFINSQKLSFINATKESGVEYPSYSNGSAYADLDKDGDLDLIVHNIDAPVFLFRNDLTHHQWLQIVPEPTKGNPIVMGTNVEIYSDGQYQCQTLLCNKGFLSASEPILHFGLGDAVKIDTMILRWPNGATEIMTNVPANQRLTWKKGDGKPFTPTIKNAPAPMFTKPNGNIKWTHREDDFVDFKREKLLPYMLSAEGPCLSVGDLNGDKLEDIFIGNGAGFPAAMFVQQKNGVFIEVSIPAFNTDAVFEDCGSVIEDVDGDGDNDLIVVSGGNAASTNAAEYKSRLYTNDGKGSLTKDATFPDIRTNAGAVLAFDYDGDDDKDFLIAGKGVPGRFPSLPKSYLLRNDQGKFTDVTKDVFPALDGLGMISDVKSADINEDGKPEVLFAGEWFPLSVYSFDGKTFRNETSLYGLEKTSGWWKCVTIEDIDSDGDMDIVAGNIGRNHRMVASVEEPITLITNDFDGNGSLDPIMCYYHEQKLYPFAGRDAIISQIPMLKKKFLRYKPYAHATITEVFTEAELKGSTYRYTHTLETTLYRNDENQFVAVNLPYQVQLHPVYDLLIFDVNMDGRKDILLGGNFLYAESETGEMDAGNGTLLLQNQDGSFTFVNNRDHGLWITGEARELEIIRIADGREAILTGNNRGPVEMHLIIK